MNRQIFEAYVETQLAPTLSPGDVVILDNVAFHKSQRAEELIRARGAWLLFNSRPCCENTPPALSMPSAMPLAKSVTCSQPMNAETSSKSQDMRQIKCETL
jgi:hypothetical protein